MSLEIALLVCISNVLFHQLLDFDLHKYIRTHVIRLWVSILVHAVLSLKQPPSLSFPRALSHVMFLVICMCSVGCVGI